MIQEIKAFKVKETGKLYGWHKVTSVQPNDQIKAWHRLAHAKRKGATTLILDNNIIVEYQDEITIYTKY